MKKINIELFRFNHTTDYLPYYKKYNLKNLDENLTVLQLLNQIKEIETFSFANDDSLLCKINNFYVRADQDIASIIEKSSSTLTIEPISIYVAQNDLLINESLYNKSLDIFNSYLTKEQKKEYLKTYKLDYFASNTLNFNKDYIGDHCLLVAFDIIEQNPSLSKEILELITDKSNGIYFHTSLKNRVFEYSIENEEKIQKLLDMVLLTDPQTQIFTQTPDHIKQKFSNFNIAVYEGLESCDAIKSLIEKSEANYVQLDSKNDDLNLKSYKIESSLTHKIAGTILLEAKDNNADFLVVQDVSYLEIFDQQQKKIECAIGREINLPVISAEQFVQLLEGQKDQKALNFDKHKTAITFL